MVSQDAKKSLLPILVYSCAFLGTSDALISAKSFRVRASN